MRYYITYSEMYQTYMLWDESDTLVAERETREEIVDVARRLYG